MSPTSATIGVDIGGTNLRAARISADGTIEGGNVELHLRGGVVIRHTVRHAMGHPDVPVSDDVVMCKFIDCAALAPRAPREAQVREFWDVVQNLEALRPGEFSEALRALAGQ